MSLTSCLLIMLGSAVGTLIRYLISVSTTASPHELPWSTIAINISGSFVIGFFGTLTLSNGRFPVSENLRLLLMVGICGGFTTFSSFSLQTFELLRNGYMAGPTTVVNIFLYRFPVRQDNDLCSLQRCAIAKPCFQEHAFEGVGRGCDRPPTPDSREAGVGTRD